MHGVSVENLLDVVGDLQSASRSLAASQLRVAESQIATPWQQAVDRGLLSFHQVRDGRRYYRVGPGDVPVSTAGV